MSDGTRVILDLERTCRTCLAQKSSDELRSMLENNLNSSISEVANIQLTLSSSLPSSICRDCEKYLNIALSFRKQVHNAESQLRHLILEEEPDHLTVIYKSFTVLDNGVISEDAVANIREIIGPQDELKDNLLIVENVDSDIQNSSKDTNEPKTVNHYFKDSDNLYTITEELTDDNTESLNYFVTDEDQTSNHVSNETEAVNLSKSTIVLNATLTNVIKWAESDSGSNRSGKSEELNVSVIEKNHAVVECSVETKNDVENVVKSEKIINFSCDLCSKTFRFEFIYKKHLLKHGTPMGCELCLLLFKEVNSYIIHVKQNHPDYKPFACPNCKERFFTLTPLKSHFKSHTVDRPRRFECNVCGKKFSQHNSLTIHKKSHTSLEPYKCDICHKKLAGSHSLRNHLKIHKGEKKHKCDICGATFIHRFSLRAHLRTHTGEKPFACKLCDNKFGTSSYLKIHMRTHTAEKPYVCLSCPKSFVSRCVLAAHEKTHTGEKKFQCDVCGWRSSRSADLQTHIRRHTGEKPYKCHQCCKSYKTASNLAVHRKSHSGLREHICSICDKAFGDPRTLKSHIRIHTGEMPYQCHICGHRFKQSGQLSAHRKIHQPREPTGKT